MKTLILLLMIALGVAGILYCRANLGMSQDDLNTSLENLLQRLWPVVIVLAGFIGTLLYASRRNCPD